MEEFEFKGENGSCGARESRGTEMVIWKARWDRYWNSQACCPLVFTACGSTCPENPCVVKEGELNGKGRRGCVRMRGFELCGGRGFRSQ